MLLADTQLLLDAAVAHLGTTLDGACRRPSPPRGRAEASADDRPAAYVPRRTELTVVPPYSRAGLPSPSWLAADVSGALVATADA